MNKLIFFILSLLIVTSSNATVKQLSKIKLSENVVVKIQSDNDTILVDSQSNLFTSYRGLTEVSFTVDPLTSNSWYYVTTELGGTRSLVITCRPRESARIICNDYFEQIYIIPSSESIAGVRQSFIEFDYLNSSSDSYEVIYSPNIVFGSNNEFRGVQTGVSTNFIQITDININSYIAESFKVRSSE